MSKDKGRKKNKFLKWCGIVSGIVFGFYLFYSFYRILHLNFKVSVFVSFGLTLIVVIFFTLLIYFNKRTRCIFFLMIPQFFSRRGRKLLIVYVYYLAFTGPTNHMMKNIHHLAEAITCGEVKKKLQLKNISNFL